MPANKATVCVGGSAKRWLGSCAALAALAALAILPAGGAATSEADSGLASLSGKVQERLNTLYEAAGFPGQTAGFVLPDGRSASVPVGYSDREKKIPMRATDRMFCGSIGKTFVSAVVLQLAQDGRLDLDERIERWLGQEPWFARLPNGKEITLRMLLNHTSGIRHHVGVKQFSADLMAHPDKVWVPQELVAYVLDKEPLFPAGQGWSYSDTNYILVGMIIERVTHATFYSELARRILKPLRLGHTAPSDRRVLPGVIPGYPDPQNGFGLPSKVMAEGPYPFNPQVEWTGGGLVTTSEDLARWAKSLYEGKVVQEAGLKEMLEGVSTRSVTGNKYGLGVLIRQTEWGPCYGHTGEFPGYGSAMGYFPQYRVAVAIQFNTDQRSTQKQLWIYIDNVTRIIIEELGSKNRVPTTNRSSGALATRPEGAGG